MLKQNLTPVFTFALLFLLTAVTAQGQAARTFVSSAGSDANDCSRSSPCRNFQRAHDAVASGGEVVALDSAGYGVVNITKSVTITGEGVHAAATSPSGGGNVVTINGAGITVVLRNIQVESHPTAVGGSGIFARNFAALHIDGCTVRAASTGIHFSPNSADGTPARKLFIQDSVLQNNGGSGIFLANAADTGTLSATIERTRFENNASGGGDFRFAKVTLRDCLASGNTFTGILASDGAEVNVESCVAAYNGNHGMAAFNGGIIRVSNSTAINNTQFGFRNDGTGTFESRENSTVRGNGLGNTSGTITPISGT
jgi:parallel beta helix pectate lyase-like protein